MPHRSAIRVFLVDDSDVYVRAIGALLAEHPEIEVVGRARTGAEGITLARQLIPDVVVLDLGLPDMSGWEAAAALGSSLPQTRLVILSGHDASSERDTARDADAPFVQKHEASRQLVAAVRRQADVARGIRARDALCESEARFRATFEQAGVGIAHVAPDGRWLRVNQKLCDILGYSPDALLAMAFQDITHPDDLESSVAAARQLLAGEIQTHATDKRYLRKDSTVVWVHLTATLARTPDGAPDYFISATQDITDRVLADEALRKAERLLAESQAVAHIGSWEVDVSTMRVTWSRESYRLFGVSPEAFDHSVDALLQLIHPDDRPAMEAWIAADAAGEKAPRLDFRVAHPGGRVRHLRGQGVLQRDEGRPVRLVGTVQDITEQRAMEDQFRQAQKMEAVGRLAGGIAHDFNNILAVIVGNGQFLLDALGESDPRREDAEEITGAAERAAALTRQLLAFSRRQVLEPKAVDLNAIVQGIGGMVGRLIGEDVEVSLLGPPDLGTVRADAGQIEQVIINLVVNARDAMPTGGRLEIETANVEVDETYVATRRPMRPGPYVVLSVSDTGCGMDAETQSQAFEPFFTTKEIGRGTGLGLSTCYGIVAQSGGYIWIYSEPGHGTVFKIYLPRIEDRPEAARTRPSRFPGHRGTETVLVVEDDDRVRAAVRRILAANGYEVLVARDGDEAVAVSSSHCGPIDLVLSDVIMPGCVGSEVVRRVLERFTLAKSLFMSGYTDHAVLSSGALQGGMNFIQKPFAPETLARKVREVLDA